MVCLAVASAVIYDRMTAIRADGLVRALVTCDNRDVPAVAASLSESPGRVKALLADRLAANPKDHDHRVRILLGQEATG
jgi:hypothetical protein